MDRTTGSRSTLPLVAAHFLTATSTEEATAGVGFPGNRLLFEVSPVRFSLLPSILVLFSALILHTNSAFAQKLSRAQNDLQSTIIKAQGNSPTSDTRFDDALLLHNSGSTDAAIYLLQQVQHDYPNDTRVLFKLGEMAIAGKNWAYAIEVLRRAADLLPKDVQARLVLMDVFRAYQMPIQEIKAGQEILAIDPRHVDALKRLCHLYEEQGMPDDEEAARRTLADLEPENHDNLLRLASALEKRGLLWEATVYRERLAKKAPADTTANASVARLHGLDGNRVAELKQWERVRRLPGGNTPDTRAAYRRAYRIHKRDLRLFDPWDAETFAYQSVGPVDKIRFFDHRTGYRKLFVTSGAEVGMSAHYRDQTYIPLTTVISGDRHITSSGALLEYRRKTKGDRKSLRARAGYEGVNVSGNTVVLDPENADSVTFPFVENRKFGGVTPVGDVEYDQLINRHFGVRAVGLRHVVEDLDAYVRMLTTSGAGLGLNYTWDDGTRVEALHQRDHYSDGNNRGYSLFQFSYPLLMSYPIHSRKGHRTGYLFPVPDHQVRLEYRLENYTFDHLSPLYESFSSDLRHTAILSGQHHLGGRLYLYEEGLLESGQIVQRQRGARVGFMYENPDTHDQASLLYEALSEKVLEGSQLNANLAGNSRVQGVHLTVTWHFGTGPKVDRTLPLRHK